jgi:hypothetical protein
MQHKVRYPDVTIKLVGVDSNVFAIIGAMTKGMRRQGVPQAEVDAWRGEAMSQDSYDKVLQLCMRTVNVE